MRLLLLLLFVIAAVGSGAQNAFDIDVYSPNGSAINPREMIATPDSGFAVIGNKPAFILKTNDRGDFLWSKEFAGLTFLHLAGTLDSGIVISAVNDTANCLIKLDASGNILWIKEYEPSTPSSSSGKVKESPTGELMLLTYPDKVIKTDPAGNVLWMKQYSGTVTLQDFVFTNDGGYAVSANENDRAGLIKLDSLGSVTFALSYHDYLVEQVNILQTGGNDYWITSSNGYIIHIDPAGNIVNAAKTGYSHTDFYKFHKSIYHNGEIYTLQNISFITMYHPYLAALHWQGIIQTDTSLTASTSHRLNSSSNSSTSLYHFKDPLFDILQNGDLIVASGIANDQYFLWSKHSPTVSCNYLMTNTDTLSPQTSTYSESFAITVNAISAIQSAGNYSSQSNTIPLGLQCYTDLKEKDDPSFSLFPNPAADRVFIKYEENTAGCKGRILDALGRTVRTFTVLNETSIDVGNIPGGMYCLEIIGEKGESKGRKKLMIAR